MTIKEYEHIEAQEHFADCKKCQKIIDTALIKKLTDFLKDQKLKHYSSDLIIIHLKHWLTN